MPLVLDHHAMPLLIPGENRQAAIERFKYDTAFLCRRAFLNRTQFAGVEKYLLRLRTPNAQTFVLYEIPVSELMVTTRNSLRDGSNSVTCTASKKRSPSERTVTLPDRS